MSENSSQLFFCKGHWVQTPPSWTKEMLDIAFLMLDSSHYAFNNIVTLSIFKATNVHITFHKFTSHSVKYLLSYSLNCSLWFSHRLYICLVVACYHWGLQVLESLQKNGEVPGDHHWQHLLFLHRLFFETFKHLQMGKSIRTSVLWGVMNTLSFRL